MYQRVARKLNLDPSYVSRIARGERRSESVDRALRLEIRRILKIIAKRKRTGRKRGKKASRRKTIADPS
jgi:transcriptional regulator with XRE-family HTH domain